MYIPVKLTTRANPGPCSSCGTTQAPRIEINVELKEGSDVCGPYCMACLHEGGIEPPIMCVIATEHGPGGGPGKGPVVSRSVRRRVREQERTIAQDLGGFPQRGSGNQPGFKGDFRVKGRYRGEAKLTEASQYILKHETLEKIRSECDGLERPVVVVSFVERGTLREKDAWAIIPYEDFQDLANPKG
jgi:hypothetical protein